MKNPKIKQKLTKTAEVKHIGGEPTPGTVIDRASLICYYNSYNYFHDHNDAKEYLISYFETADKDVAHKLRRIDAVRFGTTIGWIAHMKSLQCQLPEETENFFKRKLKEILSLYVPSTENVNTERSQSTENPHIAALEAMHDELCSNPKQAFDMNAWYVTNNVTLGGLREIAGYYEPLIAELEQVKKDRQCLTSLSKEQLETIKKFYTSVVEEAQNLLDNRKRQRKPRKKRAAKPQQLLKHFKHLAHDTELSISSISPERILQSTTLYAYNVKSRTLMVFQAKGEQKLSVVRTSIENFDEKLSFTKKIRKPEITIAQLVKQGKRDAAKTIKELSTKPGPMTTGRLNDQVLLLSAFS